MKDYTQYVTSLHSDKPDFLATIQALTSPLAQSVDLMANFDTVFDVDTAIGVQLDTIGLWVGISRLQAIPVANAFFSWNTTGLGWNQANWKGPYEATEGITTLDDDTYRVVIQAKIGSNYWNGASDTLQQIAMTAMASVGVECFVLDNMDMSVVIYILGHPSAVLLEMIKRGVTPPKTAGVRIAGYILADDGAPFFALSVPTTTEVAGLDFGSFGTPV